MRCKRGVETLIQELRGNPQALETAYISVITFAKGSETGGAACGVISFQPPRLSGANRDQPRCGPDETSGLPQE